ncbi:DUF805 domain-containing protein [Phreatobacter stygius]|nr:DUF805 domain-containing protein [Phreatobacter stygius]
MDFQNLDPQKLLPQFQKLLLTFEGRIGRQDFWIGAIALAVVNLIVGWFFGLIGGAFLSGLVSLVLAYPAYCLALKRSNDLDYPQTYVQAFMAFQIALTVISMFGGLGLGVLFFSILLPILGIAALALLVVLGFFQGTNGPNRYGPDPLASQAA